MRDHSRCLLTFLTALLVCQGVPAFAAHDALAVIADALQSGEFGATAAAATLPQPVPAPAPALKAPDEFEEAIVALIDELQAKDPPLFALIHAEGDRIRALPTNAQRVAAVNAGYPRLERALAKSAASGKFSPAALAKWTVFRDSAQKALADGTLFERAEFAGNAFDAKVQALLRKGTTKLDANRKLPEQKAEYMALSKRIHEELALPVNSTALAPSQLDKVFALVGREFAIRPEFLKYMAKTESGLRQVVLSNPAAVGIMQVESVHQEAYAGARNVANDTITNIVYGGLLRAQTDRAMARSFAKAGIAPPSDARVVEFLGDLAYNRGPALLKFVAQHAAAQHINVDRFADYLGGPGGSYAILNGGQNIVVLPGPDTIIDKTGKNSVLELSSEAVGRVAFSPKLSTGLGDRNGDGRVDHLDIWLTRGMRYLHDPDL